MTVIYRKGSPWYLIFQLFGSAIPRGCVAGVFSAVISLSLNQLPYDYLKHLVSHPYAFQPFSYIAAFVLVFRTNVAYHRCGWSICRTSPRTVRLSP